MATQSIAQRTTRPPAQKTRLHDPGYMNRILRFVIIAAGVLMAAGGGMFVGSSDNGMLAIVGVLGVALTVGILIRPYIGMYVLLFFIYLNLSAILEDNFGIPDLNKFMVALIAVSVIGTRLIVRGKKIIFRLTEALMLLYIFIVIMSLIAGGGINGDTFKAAIDVGKDFVIILIIVQLTTEEKVWKRTHWILLGSAAFLSIFTWYHSATGDYANNFWGFATSRTDSVADAVVSNIHFYRVGGPVGDPNFYAQILLMVFPLGLYRVLDPHKGFTRLIAIILTVLIGGAIVLTYSRAALLVMIFSIALIILERRMNPYKVVFIGVVVFTLALPVLPEGYVERMGTLVGIGQSADSQEDVSMRGRSSEMIVATQMFQDHPFLGIGYSLYEETYLDYSVKLGLDNRLEERQAHSLYLEAAAETGIFGFVTMMLMYGMVLYSVFRARSQLFEIGRDDLVPWVSAVGIGLAAYLASSFFLHDDYIRYLRISLALAASASVMVDNLVVHHNEKTKNDQSDDNNTYTVHAKPVSALSGGTP